MWGVQKMNDVWYKIQGEILANPRNDVCFKCPNTRWRPSSDSGVAVRSSERTE